MLAVATCALMLTGCAQPDPVVTSRATSTVKPLFASDADALAAATKAYAAYLKMSDLIAQEGGANPERLAPLVTPKWLKHERGASAALAASKKHQDGKTSFDHAKLQSYSSDTEGRANIGVYVCVDLSDDTLLNADDVDVTPEGVQARFPFVVNFVSKSPSSAALLLKGSEAWDGQNYC